jgi:two-component system NtrC family sensor kinase
MRVGVSAKVLLAYAVLLVALGANSAFSVASLHSAGQHVMDHQSLLEVDGKIRDANRQLERLAALNQGTLPTLGATYLAGVQAALAAGRAKLETFLARSGTLRREDFDGYLEGIVGLEQQTRVVRDALAAAYTADGGKEGVEKFRSDLEALRFEKLDVFSNKLLNDAVRVIGELHQKEQRAARAAIFLGLAGLLGALGAALSVWRTLRPLRELRLRARQLAGGDYGRRIGLRTRDEIGDLAREFDSMAQALEEREQRLIRSERLATVGRIAAQITHEIRNPLASIGLNAELIADELNATQNEARRQVATITAEVDRLSEITESYLRFVRLPRLKLEREDPAALVTPAMEFARAELAQAGIELQLQIAPDLPDIAADENQLRQALLNLLRNAKEAMPGGGRIQVALDTREPGRVTVSVSDTGGGIPAEHVARVFEPFFSTKAKGTGLGLALVHQILNEHGGRVDVESSERGTTFLLSFPALPPPSAETLAPTIADESPSSPSLAALPRRI